MITELETLVEIRDGRSSDRAFILATFLRSLYYGDSWFSQIPKNIFMYNYHKIAEVLLNSKNVLVKVACLKEDTDVILGYSILSKDLTIIHFCFVKSAWRKQGIGSALLPSTINKVTHLTQLGKSLLPKLKDTIFDPFALNL
jgi:hypothetical protein